MRRISHLLSSLIAAACFSVAAAPPSLEELLKPAQHDLVSISPGGTYIAATFRKTENKEDKMMMVIIDRATGKPVRLLDPEERGGIDSISWANDQRLFLVNSRYGRKFAQQYLEGYVLAINVDGTRKRVVHGSLIDPLVDDDDNILVEWCSKLTLKGCMSYIEKTDNDGSRKGKRIVDSPDDRSFFYADNAGQIRFAYSWDDESWQKVWLLKSGQWTMFSDERETGVETKPIGSSRDGSAVFLYTERKSGPDAIEKYVFATGERTVAMSDPVLDPAFVVWSADRRQPIGAAYGTGVPRARFWDTNDPDAKLLRQLEAAFPEDAVLFSSGSRDGQHIVVVVFSDRDPGSYYLMDRAKKTTALLARAKPWLNPETLARAQPFAFKARDGLELNGYLTLPVDAKGIPPLVVMPHGGPYWVQDEWGYDEEVQILAAHGYAVLRVNFRGSDGFGWNFINAGRKQWGKKMQDDVTDATRWAIAQGKIDPQRICIFGTSYGGYAALMGVVREPTLYRCAISTAGATDLNITRKWGDTHQTEGGRHYLDTYIGEDPAELFENSPLKHVAKIQVPVLLVHGEHDPRVSFEHAKAMQAAMQKAGKPLETYFFANETHGIYSDKNRKEYYDRVLRFLSANLKKN
ncbi:MAG: S9 family peptidase [Lysobacter sp.]|nr:S9 family peptidase [Lysobacter sp.]